MTTARALAGDPVRSDVSPRRRERKTSRQRASLAAPALHHAQGDEDLPLFGYLAAFEAVYDDTDQRNAVPCRSDAHKIAQGGSHSPSSGSPPYLLRLPDPRR